MTTIQATIPDHLAQLAHEAAAREHTTLDSIVAIALASHVGVPPSGETMEARAGRANVERFREILDSRPDRPPLPGDEL